MNCECGTALALDNQMTYEEHFGEGDGTIFICSCINVDCGISTVEIYFENKKEDEKNIENVLRN